MLSSTRWKLWLVAAGALVAAPALAHGQAVPPSTASYTASDSATASRDTYRWYVTGSTQTDATILPGGTVSFSNPAGAARPHNVDFTGDLKPQCRLDTSETTSTGPMPAAAARAWSGTCTFAQPGAYRFVCDLHPAMAGTITVSAPDATATATPTPISGPPSTPAAPAPSVPAQPVLQPSAAIWITVGHHQKGTNVRGSMIVSRPGTRVEITLLSRRVALGLKGRRRVVVGRTLFAAAPDGELQFSLKLNATARRALRVRKTLPVLVRVKASAVGTTPVDRIQAVRLGRPVSPAPRT